MTDTIILPPLPTSSNCDPWLTKYTYDFVQEYATAAVLADRETREPRPIEELEWVTKCMTYQPDPIRTTFERWASEERMDLSRRPDGNYCMGITAYSFFAYKRGRADLIAKMEPIAYISYSDNDDLLFFDFSEAQSCCDDGEEPTPLAEIPEE
jgi:hypothetical protein